MKTFISDNHITFKFWNFIGWRKSRFSLFFKSSSSLIILGFIWECNVEIYTLDGRHCYPHFSSPKFQVKANSVAQRLTNDVSSHEN